MFKTRQLIQKRKNLYVTSKVNSEMRRSMSVSFLRVKCRGIEKMDISLLKYKCFYTTVYEWIK